MCVKFEETQSEDIHSVFFLCYVFTIDWVIVWNVAGLLIEMCLADVLVGIGIEPFLFILQRSCFICFLCVRVLCVASLWFCCNYVLDLIFLMLHAFPEVCICKWRVLNWFTCSIFECHRSLFLLKKSGASDVVSAICGKTFSYFKARQRWDLF